MRDTADAIGEKTLDEKSGRANREGSTISRGEAAGVGVRFWCARGRGPQMVIERGKEGGDAGLARENYRDKYAHCIVRALSVCASHINVSIGARVQRGGCEKERRRDTTYTQEVVERWI